MPANSFIHTTILAHQEARIGQRKMQKVTLGRIGFIYSLNLSFILSFICHILTERLLCANVHRDKKEKQTNKKTISF